MRSGLRVAACGALLVLFAGAESANATTTVTGDRDTDAPLTIDPAGDPSDPEVAPSYGLTVFIESMPVTKQIDRVTLGDLGTGPDCNGEQDGMVFVEQNAEGEGTAGDEIARGPITVPQALGRVTATIPKTTLVKGKSYTFIAGVTTSCGGIQRTWAHNSAVVNGGDAPCAPAPRQWWGSDLFGPNQASPQRMWHIQGQADRDPGCIPEHTFEPSAPTGWLETREYCALGNCRGIRGANYDTDGPICSDGQGLHKLGREPIYWRQNPGNPYPSDQNVCAWTQFTPPGQNVDDGWYWTWPWNKDDTGTPRDAYLKLGTIDYTALLEAHQPFLRYHSEEGFHALSPAAATDFYDASGDPDSSGDSNRLVDGAGPFAIANPSLVGGTPFQDPLSLGYLAGRYPDIGYASRRATTPADSGDYISLRGDLGFPADSGGYADDAATMEARLGYADRTYGRVAYGSDGALWLQYWLFYYYDDQARVGSGVHEGDWEMVQVRLDAADRPDQAAYAQHGYDSPARPRGETCGWPQVESFGGRPIVYVAQGSHASYFHAGTYTEPSPTDNADGQGISGSPIIDQIQTDSPSWVAWPGKWGDSRPNSPLGPAFQGLKWDDPSSWAQQLRNCDVT